MPVVGTAAYGTLQVLMNLARSYVNDTFTGATGTPGEGRIFTDDAPFTLPFINASISDYQRELDNASVPTLTKEVFFLSTTNTGVPPISSPLGVGQPNPAAQQMLSYTGFFDGYQNYQAPALPVDLLVPKRIWYRQSNTGLTFTEFDAAPAGLVSCFQDQTPGQWDWRGNSLFWNGATVPLDMRLRYTAQVTFYGYSLSPNDFATTYLPFRDATEILALMVAEKFCSSRLPDGATAGLQQKIQMHMDKTINRQVKAMQTRRYSRGAYGETGDIFNW